MALSLVHSVQECLQQRVVLQATWEPMEDKETVAVADNGMEGLLLLLP